MKKSEWSDKQLEDILKHLPEVKDRQDRKELFHKISSRIQDEQIRKTNKKIWIFPSVAAVAALFIILIIGPSLLNYISGTNDESANESGAENREFGIVANDDSHQSKVSIAESTEKKSDIMMVGIASTSNIIQENEVGEGQTVVTIGLMDPMVQHVIPVSFLYSEANQTKLEVLQDVIQRLSYGNLGLEPSPLQGLILEEVDLNKVVITIPTDYTVGSASAQIGAFFQPIQETLRWMGYTEVEFKTPEGNQVEMDPVGPVNTIELSSQTKIAYHTYYSGNGKTYLAANQYEKYESLEAALTSMRDPNTEINTDLYLNPSIPLEIKIEYIVHDKTNVKVAFSKDSIIDENNQTHRIMIEAILLTAKEFGFSSVTFINTPDQIGGVILRENGKPKQVDVPVAPNPIDFPASN